MYQKLNVMDNMSSDLIFDFSRVCQPACVAADVQEDSSEQGKSIVSYFGGDELAASVWMKKYAMKGEGSADEFLGRPEKKEYTMNRTRKSRRLAGWNKSPEVVIEQINDDGATQPTVVPTIDSSTRENGVKHYYSKFALYHLQYTWDRQRDMFSPNNWERREELFNELFEKEDSMEFTIGEKHYRHKLYHCKANRRVIVMRLANVKELLLEKDFEEMPVKHYPSCFVVIDNRAGSRRVIIQKLQTSFSSTFQVARILQNNISHTLTQGHNIGVMFHPQRYTQDFYKLWKEHPDTTKKVRFNISSGVKKEELSCTNTVCGIMQNVENASRSSDYCTTVEISGGADGTTLPVDETSDYIKGLVQYSACTGCSIELVTTDGASFTCFINSDVESTDKIVSYEMDAGYLEQLFDNQVDDKTESEEKVIEFLNGIKYLVDENEMEVK